MVAKTLVIAINYEIFMLNFSENWFANLKKEAPKVITDICEKYETEQIGYLEFIYYLQFKYQFLIIPTVDNKYSYKLLKNGNEVKPKYPYKSDEEYFDTCLTILIFHACIDLEYS